KLLRLHAAKSFNEKLKIIASIRPSDFKPEFPAIVEPRTHLSMGQHRELMVQEWGIGRAAQDELALKSHQNAMAAYKNHFYDDLVIEFMGLKQDGIPRADTSLEKLAKLKPAFDFTGKGSLTAGNSSPLTDGAAAVFLTSAEAAKEFNYP